MKLQPITAKDLSGNVRRLDYRHSGTARYKLASGEVRVRRFSIWKKTERIPAQTFSNSEGKREFYVVKIGRRFLTQADIKDEANTGFVIEKMDARDDE